LFTVSLPSRIALSMRLHKQKIVDALVVIAATAAASFYAYNVDIFYEATSGTGGNIDLPELFALSALFCLGLVVYSMRRLREAERETLRRIKAEREARTLALHDQMTGLPNRRQFENALNAALEAPPSASASHALLLLDLNGFKRVNDLYGHPTGDELLVQVGGRLSRAVREGDLVARLGGDEFAILALHIQGAEAATSLALRIVAALDTDIDTGLGRHGIGTAIGISLFPQDSTDAEELLRMADIALYRAKAEKHAARSSFRFFETNMDAFFKERDRMELALREAIASKSVHPDYQPLVSTETGEIIGFEALARWTSDELGEVSPTRFIPLAEDTGLIIPLTELLLEQACRDALPWPPEVSLAFNLSGVLLQSDSFGLHVLAILARTRLPPQRLELEITETALVRNLEGARRVLGGLRETGIRIALDDFGTGYSSLYHLRAFRPDKIKIDRSFIEGIEHEKDNAAIVQALVGLGSGLGARVTAEGVETAGQLSMLRDQGCSEVQGYHLNKAVTAQIAREMVGSRLGQSSAEA